MGESNDNADGTVGNVEMEGSVEMLGLFSRLAGNVDGLKIVEETSRRDSSMLVDEEEATLPSTTTASLVFSSFRTVESSNLVSFSPFSSASFSTLDLVDDPSCFKSSLGSF